MRTIFVGGPGRSGTSFVAERLAHHPDISAFRDIELKLFTEKNGLLDLWHSLIERYSPNRAAVARQQFKRLTDALIAGQFGQPGLKTVAPAEAWTSVFDRFLENAFPSGAFERADLDQFRRACRQLLQDVAQLSVPSGASPKIFLEKTPHALLAVDFLAEIAPGAGFIHIMRDPRSIAQSLRGMRWGPSDLNDCCAWVSGYCAAWLDAQKLSATQGIEVTSLHIEDIADHPDRCTEYLCDATGLSRQPDLLNGASISILNGWAEKASTDDISLLNKRLVGWVRHFGYSVEHIGQRKLVDPITRSFDAAAADTPPTEDLVAELL